MELLPVIAGFQFAFALLFLYLTTQRYDRSYLFFGLVAALSGMYYLLTPDYFPSGSGRWVDKLALTALCAYYGVFPWYVRELTGAKRNFWLGMGMAALTITWLGAVSSGSWSWSAYWPHIGRIVIACIAIYITTGYYQSRDKLSKSLRNSLAIAILAFNLLFVNELFCVYILPEYPPWASLLNLPLLDYYPVLFTVLMVHALNVERSKKIKLEFELEEKQVNWNTLLDGVQLIVLKVSQEGKILAVNQYFRKNFSNVDWTGLDIREAVPEVQNVVGHITAGRDFQSSIKTASETHQIHWHPISIEEDHSTSNILLGLDQSELFRSNQELEQTIESLNRLKEKLQKENISLKRKLELEGIGGIVGTSNAMYYVFDRIHKIAPANTTVLILGETGVGKGLVARAIHDLSPRNHGPFISINCAAIPDTLLESELFGYRKGAFTGAGGDKKGQFELADKGTLFLDEIGEMSLELQAKLLHVLQDGSFTPLGSEKVIRTDVRIITATNKDLLAYSKDGRFRQDLYYRLSIYPITIQPLRDRKIDIPVLVEHFIEELSQKYGKHFDEIDSQSMEQFLKYDWPGNVRELMNVIERSIIESDSGIFELHEDLVSVADLFDTKASEKLLSLAEQEKHYLVKVLTECDWKIAGNGGAAEVLGIPSSTLRSRMKKHEIHKPN